MWFLILTVVGCAIVLVIDATPGLLSSGLLCPCVGLFALAAAVMPWTAVAAGLYVQPAANRRRRRYIWAAAGVVALSAVLWLAFVPSRVALWASRGEFEALLANAPQTSDGEPLGRRVGGVYVDQYGADSAGGVFFRTASHADGLGPDTMSYGFAHRPHRESCPFGRSSYQAVWLFGEWYWFSVSND